MNDSTILWTASPCNQHSCLPSPSLTGHARNPHCDDLVGLDLAVDEGGRMREAWHDSRGYLVSRTAASVLCRKIGGKTLTKRRAMMSGECVAIRLLTERRESVV